MVENEREDDNLYRPLDASIDTDIDSNAQDQAYLNLASRKIRLIAAVIEAVIYFVILAPFLHSIGQPSDLGTASGEEFFTQFILFFMVPMTMVAGINFVLLYKNSQTIGKKILRIKIVRSDGSHARVLRILVLRFLIHALVLLIPIIGAMYVLINILFIFGDQQRCIHDFVADTVVVYDR